MDKQELFDKVSRMKNAIANGHMTLEPLTNIDYARMTAFELVWNSLTPEEKEIFVS